VTVIGLILLYNTYTEFHESLTNDLVPTTRSQADELLDMVSTQDYNILIRHERPEM